MTNIDIFKPPETLDKAADILSDHMPQGRAWGSKNIPGSNMRGIIRGLAIDFLKVQEQIYELSQQFDINLSIDLLPEWETSVGIPDDCIFDLSTLIERRENILGRFSKIPVVTKEDFENLALLLTGLTVTVEPGIDYEEVFPLTFPITFGEEGARFIMYVTFGASSESFTYTFPFDFPAPERFDIVKCVFARVRPANVRIIYTN